MDTLATYPYLYLVDGGTKDSIISILSVQWPLSAKKIHNILFKRGVGITYQAVYKTISILVEQGILTKSDQNYKLNTDWIKKVKRFSIELEDSYEREKLHVMHELETKGFCALKFDRHMSLANFLVDFLHSGSPRGGTKIMYSQYIWNPFIFSREQHDKIKEVGGKVDCYYFAQSDTIVDRWLAKYWAEAGYKVRTGVKDFPLVDTIIFNELIMQLFFSDEMKKTQLAARRVKRIEDVDMEILTKHIMEDNFETNALLTVDNHLSRKLVAKALSLFSRSSADP